MNGAKNTTDPLLLVVAGRPGAGKTTLARKIVGAIRCPAICRDEFKEGLVHSIDRGYAEPERVEWHVYDAFFETADRMLRRGISLVAEAAFQHALWARGLEPLRPHARVRIVRCTVSPEVAHDRITERSQADPSRGHYHGADPVAGAAYEPLDLDVPTLDVDTTDGYSPGLDRVVAFASG